MRTLEHFKEFCDEMTSSASRKHKQEVLTKYKDDEIIQRYLKINFDPYTVYGISSKKLAKRVRPVEWFRAATVFELFDYLAIHNTGRDEDIAACREMLFVAGEVDPVLESLLGELICKDLSIGADSKILNSVMPNLIPTFNVQLAQRYFDKPDYWNGKRFAITTKIDGGRIIAIKENGQVSFYTRAGQRYEGLVDLEQEMLEKLPDNICLDGEITLLDYKNYDSKAAYKETMKRTRKDGTKSGIKMLVFDCMSAEQFKNQSCPDSYGLRRAILDTLFANKSFTYFEPLPLLYVGEDTSMIIKLLDEAVANNQEGIMLNDVFAPYSFTRTWALCKVKKFNSLDLEVVGMEEGSGRLSGTLGAIHVRYKDGNIVKVGSGFSDEERKLYWENPNLILNKIVEVKYFEECTSGSEFSLRFPTWVSNIRTDKLTPDF